MCGAVGLLSPGIGVGVGVGVGIGIGIVIVFVLVTRLFWEAMAMATMTVTATRPIPVLLLLLKARRNHRRKPRPVSEPHHDSVTSARGKTPSSLSHSLLHSSPSSSSLSLSSSSRERKACFGAYACAYYMRGEREPRSRVSYRGRCLLQPPSGSRSTREGDPGPGLL